MTARAFTKRWVIALLITAITAIAFPLLLAAIVAASDCDTVGGSCGALALMLGIFLRLPVVIGVGVYLSIQAWKRSEAIGLKPWGFVMVAISYLAASPLIYGLGNFWAARLALGLDEDGTLPSIGFLIASLIGLSCLSTSSSERSKSAPRIATFATGGFSLILLLPTAIEGLSTIPFISGLRYPLFSVANQFASPLLKIFGPYAYLLALIMFIASLTWWVQTQKEDRQSVVS